MKESHASVSRGMVSPARLFCIATSRSLPSPHEPYTRGDRADAANSASERWTDSRTPPQEHKRLNVGERVRGSTPNNQAFARARDSAFTELLLDTQDRGLLYTLRGITSPCLLHCALSLPCGMRRPPWRLAVSARTSALASASSAPLSRGDHTLGTSCTLGSLVGASSSTDAC